MRLLFSLLLLCGLLPATAQPTPPADASGAALRVWLKTHWYDGRHHQLSYVEARRQMYNTVDNHENQVEGVYGGFLRSLTAGGNESNPMPINAEHTVPQSFFDKRLPMRSDMHHLFPTHQTLNSARANYPFAEVPDDDTEQWLIGTGRTGRPGTDIDAFSEEGDDRFEPREVQKGNTARAVFYFYTMYPDFDIARIGDRAVLYAWHLADPPDDRERARNDGIEAAQGNRNPYIDHPDWVARAWQPDLDATRAVLTGMGLDPDVVLAGTPSDGPDPGNPDPGNPDPGNSDGPDPARTLATLRATQAHLEAALAEIRAEIARLEAL